MAVKSAKLRFQILERDGFRCQYCGAKGSDTELHVDHIHPESKGGTDDPKNLIAACQPCNLGKSDTILRRKQSAIGRLEELGAFPSRMKLYCALVDAHDDAGPVKWSAFIGSFCTLEELFEAAFFLRDVGWISITRDEYGEARIDITGYSDPG